MASGPQIDSNRFGPAMDTNKVVPAGIVTWLEDTPGPSSGSDNGIVLSLIALVKSLEFIDIR